jgi:GTP cyclohydrolase I
MEQRADAQAEKARLQQERMSHQVRKVLQQTCCCFYVHVYVVVHRLCAPKGGCDTLLMLAELADGSLRLQQQIG